MPQLVATEAVLLAVRQLCSSEVFKRFYESYPSMGGETILDDPSVDSAAAITVAQKQPVGPPHAQSQYRFDPSGTWQNVEQPA